MKTDASIFSSTLVKIAKEDSKNYLNQMAYFAPAAAVQGLADAPKGTIDKGLENKILGKPFKSQSGPSPIRVGLGRGAGRITAAMVTTPMFITGIRDLSQAKTKKERNNAFGKVVAAGGIYAGLKGSVEAGVTYGSPFAKDQSGKRTQQAVKSLNKIKGIASVRGVIGVGSAALTAKAVADNIKKTKGQKGFYNDVVKPSMAGFTIGAAKGLVEKGIVDKTIAPRKLLAAGVGRGTAGAIGAVVLDKITKSFTKKASSNQSVTQVSPAVIYQQIKGWSAKQDSGTIKTQYLKMMRDDPERSPTSRAMYYAMYHSLAERNVQVPKPRLIENVHPPESASSLRGLGILAASYAPKIVEEATHALPKSQTDKLLSDSLDNMLVAKGVNRLRYESPRDEGIYIPDSHTVSTSRNASSSTIAHEAGHASASKLRKKLLQSSSAVSSYAHGSLLAYLVPLGAMALASDRSFATKEELKAKENLVKSLGAVTTGMMAPVLLEEGIANVKGLGYTIGAAKHNKVPVKPQVLRYILKQGPKMAGYLAPMLAPMLTAKYFKEKSGR